ncbi:MAG TPA: hypothetical protein VMV10_17695 [Pirellulales bacterium]|nr:hypothetical protein [Pirellulales bacterium]
MTRYRQAGGGGRSCALKRTRIHDLYERQKELAGRRRGYAARRRRFGLFFRLDEPAVDANDGR